MGADHKEGVKSSTGGLTDGKRAWIRKRVQEVLEQAARKQVRSVSHRTERDRVEAIAGVYRDLWVLGYRMEKVEALAPRHLVALVQDWKARGLARETAQVRWSHLRLWCVILGKQGMASPFPEVWPVEELPEKAAGGAGRGRRNLTLQSLTDEQYAELLDVLQNERSTQTGYWLVRCIRELKLKREEAFLFEPRRALKHGDPSALVWSAKGRDQRAVSVGTPEKVALVEGVRQYLERHERVRLGWPENSLAQMTWRYRNLLTYAIKRLKTVEQGQAAEGMAQGTAPDRGEEHAADEMKALLESWPGPVEDLEVGECRGEEGVPA